MSKRYYHKYSLGVPLIYFYNKELCIKDEMLYLAPLDDTTCKGELAAVTESIAHCFMVLSCKLINALGHIF